jgi:isoquinoline 1-oxidoreductase subunit alpha
MKTLSLPRVPGWEPAHRVQEENEEEDETMATYQLSINGSRKTVDVDPSTPLLWVLREELKLTGTKYGCGISACGACTVHVDGFAMRSCVVPVSLIGERPIVTIEGIANDPVGRAVQNAWVEKDVVQCGYCQSGQIMSAVALLKAMPSPSETNIEESMGGNLCRCATYVRIREAIKSASLQVK